MRVLAHSLAFLILAAAVRTETTTERHVQFRAEDAVIAGTLNSPSTAGAHPAIVVVPGAGNFDRKMVAQINAIIREPLLTRGYSVLFYDKRGLGESTGQPTDDIRESAKVAEAAVESLKREPDIDPRRIALYAVSNGAWIAPIVASQSHDVRALVLVSAAPFSPLEQDLFAYEHIDYIRDGNREIARRASAVRTAIHTYLATGEGYEAAKTAYATIASDPTLSYMKSEAPASPAILPTPAELPGARLSEYFRTSTFDPMPYLMSIRQPTLVVLGERDPLVDAKRSAEVFQRLGQQKPGWNLTVKVFPGAGHGIEMRESDRSPIHNPSASRPRGYPDAMLDWIDAQMRP